MVRRMCIFHYYAQRAANGPMGKSYMRNMITRFQNTKGELDRSLGPNNPLAIQVWSSFNNVAGGKRGQVNECASFVCVPSQWWVDVEVIRKVATNLREEVEVDEEGEGEGRGIEGETGEGDS